MATDLSKVGERERLKPQREPHWQRLHAGCFLGFRPSKRGGKGTWIARAYDEDAKKYLVKSLGDLGGLAGNEMFSTAKKQAENLAEIVRSGGEIRSTIQSVADACREYARTRPEAAQRFNRYVYEDPISRVKLDKLRRHHLRQWRERIEAQPALVSRRMDGTAVERKRAASTVNRDMAPLRAALRKVLPPGAPNTDAAWQEALLATPNANGRRTLYLDPDQRRKLIEMADAEVAPFIRGLCHLPLRPGALAQLVVRDFDSRTSELSIAQDKTGRPRRIVLPPTTAALLTQQAIDKLPGAPLFMRSNGKSWNKDSWKKAVSRAAAKANLPVETTAYTLRHSTITDLVRSGLDLLTIAQISDTSAEMIERHYGHLAKDAAVKALEALSL